MRIGVVTSSFPRWPGDVAGSFVLGFARALASRGHEIEVVAPEPREQLDPAAFDGIRVTTVPYLRPRVLQRTFYGAGAPENLARDPLAVLGAGPFVAALTRELASRLASWDAVASHWLVPSGLAVALALEWTGSRARLPHLAVLHSGDVHALARTPGGAMIARWVARRASSLLFVSPHLRDLFLSLLGPVAGASVASRSHVSPMGIDAQPAAPARREARKRWRLDRFTLLYLGRLVPVKGVDTLLAATAGVRELEVVVAGEGPDRERLEATAASRGVYCRFVGSVHGEQKRTLLAGADAFVVPSRVLSSGRTEGVPVSMLEAMASGLPVIASDVGGIGSLVARRGAALLVPPDRPRALADAIAALRTRPELSRSLVRSGRSLAVSLRWDRLAPSLVRLLCNPDAPLLPLSGAGAS